jgi:hypothetical protein
MTTTEVKSDAVYDHDKYGEVLVSNIAVFFDSWDVTEEDSTDSNPVVLFHSRFDDYGGMGNPLRQSIGDFIEQASMTDTTHTTSSELCEGRVD